MYVGPPPPEVHQFDYGVRINTVRSGLFDLVAKQTVFLKDKNNVKYYNHFQIPVAIRNENKK